MRYLLLTIFLFVACLPLSAQTSIGLNDNWKFKLGEQALAESVHAKDKDWEPVTLPHTWNNKDVYDEEKGFYQGVGWYRKTFKVSRELLSKENYLRFEGANQVTDVFVNGKFVGRHTGGYTAFNFPVSEFLLEGKNLLAVRVDNSGNANVPPLSADFTFYGGIYRDVYLLSREKVHFDLENLGSFGVFVETPKVNRQSAEVLVRGALKAVKGANKEKYNVVTTLLNAQGGEVSRTTTAINPVPGQKTSFKATLKPVQTPELWSPENPYLYQLDVKLTDSKGKVVDRQSIEVGFRWFRFDPEQGFFLNDKSVKLWGANRHQDFENLGNALPNPIHKNDIALLKAMGANFIRIAHYPQDPEILKACDRLGIIAWEEIPIVNAITVSQEFTDNSRVMLQEMIRQNYNHPAVMMWGFMNEVLLSLRIVHQDTGVQNKMFEKYLADVRALAVELNTALKKEDPNRYSVIAHHGNFDLYQKAGLNDVTDVVGWNLYHGWYTGNFEGFGEFLDRHRKELPGKPLIIAEYGAGSDARIHAPTTARRFDFSVEWQQRYNEEYARAALKRPFVAGMAIWNFVDFNSEGRKDAIPHINQKGMVRHNRDYKDIYFFYRALLQKQPVLHINTIEWNVQAGTANESGTSIRPITVYTNLPEAEFFLNGKSLGVKKPQEMKAMWEVPFAPGINVLEAKSGDGRITDKSEIKFKMYPVNLKSGNWDELCVNNGAYFDFHNPLTDEVWLADKPYTPGSWGYVGGKYYTIWAGVRIGTEMDILGTELDPLYQTQIDSLEAYKFDVPDGHYELELHFADFMSVQDAEKLLYNLGADAGANKNESIKVFSVSVNGSKILEDFSPIEEAGSLRAIAKSVQLYVTDGKGIEVKFDAQSGKSILNGIKIKKL